MLQERGRRLKPVNCLKADGRLPRVGAGSLIGRALAYIHFKLKAPRLHLIVRVDSPYNRAMTSMQLSYIAASKVMMLHNRTEIHCLYIK